VIVVMIAIAVPASTQMIVNASNERVDRVLLTMGTIYASSLLEVIMSDVSRGAFDELANESAYLETPGTGLWARTSWIAEPYEARQLTAAVTISELVARDGTVSANPDENRFRIVTVSVGVPTASGQVLNLPISMMVGDPNP